MKKTLTQRVEVLEEQVKKLEKINLDLRGLVRSILRWPVDGA